MFLRLRQLCLVAGQLEPVVDTLSAVFGVPVCHRDPEVGRFGLHNALLALGSSFVEVVAPTREGTAAGRYLQRRGGDGGYMVILDTDDLPHWRHHVADIGVRIAAPLALGDYEGAQLHPQDTGGALLEINTTRGGADLLGAYGPAGPHWQQAVRTDRVDAIFGAVLQGPDPARLAARWGQILQRPVVRIGDEWRLAVDNAVLRFVPADDGRGEGLSGIDLRVKDGAAILRTAQELGCDCGERSMAIGGVRFAWAAAAA
jgi:hypothetical protein